MPKDLHKVERFFKAADKCETIKIGFDSCSMSGIVRWMNVPRYLVEPCEAARFSAFVSEDMKMYPCSFMVDKEWCGDLRKNSLVDIWKSNEYFLKFRDNLLPLRCEGCGFSDVCRGGCRLFEEINWC
jgi:radical SAM protein with 4Fe4S-binding SPASM domain